MSDASAVTAVRTIAPTLALSEPTIFWLAVLATVGLAVLWGTFWFAVARSRNSVQEILASPGFFRSITVVGVVAATVVLTLAERLEGNMAGAILSGIVGYVLGQLSPRGRKGPDSGKKTADQEQVP